MNHRRTHSQTNGAFTDAERAAVYRAIFERRDVRRNFRSAPIPDAVVGRVLNAAHHAGSVGFMQPWDFILIRREETRAAIKGLFIRANAKAAKRYTGSRQALYGGLKLEGIEEAPLCVCVTCSRHRGGPQVLGRSTVFDTDLYSTCCAIQNLWLAARAEGVGVGWVSILDHGALKRLLGIPRTVKVVALLCLGHVAGFERTPDLAQAGWRQRLPLDALIHHERWEKRSRPHGRTIDAHHQGVHKDGRRRKDPPRRG